MILFEVATDDLKLSLLSGCSSNLFRDWLDNKFRLRQIVPLDLDRVSPGLISAIWLIPSDLRSKSVQIREIDRNQLESLERNVESVSILVHAQQLNARGTDPRVVEHVLNLGGVHLRHRRFRSREYKSFTRLHEDQVLRHFRYEEVIARIKQNRVENILKHQALILTGVLLCELG